MKISGHDVSPAHKARVQKREATSDAPAAASEGRHAASPSSEVRVSEASRALTAPETPDAARVARLREAIADGTFAIDAERIAERMLDEER